jgi:nucleoside-diphosphate-sugar epimerase
MVIGKGLVAKAFKQYVTLDQFLIFASGVSNSKSCTTDDLLREHHLLVSSIRENPSKKVVYFSTSSVNDPDLQGTLYIDHKLNMEELVKKEASNYHIFRLSNLAGASANPNTILHFFYSSIGDGHPFELWKYSERNIIDVEDVFKIIHYILENNLFVNQVVNIANETNYPVGYIVRCIEAFTHKKAIFTEKERGKKFEIDTSDIRPICKSLQISFGDDYLPALLAKYYPH